MAFICFKHFFPTYLRRTEKYEWARSHLLDHSLNACKHWGWAKSWSWEHVPVPHTWQVPKCSSHHFWVYISRKLKPGAESGLESCATRWDTGKVIPSWGTYTAIILWIPQLELKAKHSSRCPVALQKHRTESAQNEHVLHTTVLTAKTWPIL